MGDNAVTTGGASYAVVPNNDGKVATQAYDEICKYLTETGLSAEDAKKVAALVVKLDKDLKVIDESDPNAPNEDGEYPVLEAASDALVDGVDLAILAAKLKIDSEKFQAFVRKTGLDHLNNELDEKIAERLEKIAETLKKMDKAARASLFSKIFGWLMVAVSIFLAVATCCLAGAVVIGAVLGAVVALSMQTVTQTGAMEKLTKALVRRLQELHPDWSKRDVEILAALIITGSVLIVSVGAGFCPGQIGQGSSAVSKGAARAIKAVQKYLDAALKGIGHGIQLYSAIVNYSLGRAQAKSTDVKSMLKTLRRDFETQSDELAAIIAQLMNDDVSNTLEKAAAGLEDLANKMKRMA